MNHPKRQHWVPEFYLRYFATPETRNKKIAKAWVFSKHETDGDECLKSVREVCGMNYLYTPKDEMGEIVWHLEDKLGDLETTMGLIWPNLANGFVDINDPVLRKGLSLFVAIMHLRNPECRQSIERLHQQLVEFFETVPVRPDGSPAVNSLEVAGVTCELEAHGWREYQAWGKNDHDRFFAHVVESASIDLATLLMKKRWSIVFSEPDIFITSDRPVVLQHQSRETFGFGTQNSIVTFPLSPRRMLMMDDFHAEPAGQYYPLKPSNAGAFNYNIWSNSSRFMVTGRAVPNVLSEILASAR